MAQHGDLGVGLAYFRDERGEYPVNPNFLEVGQKFRLAVSLYADNFFQTLPVGSCVVISLGSGILAFAGTASIKTVDGRDVTRYFDVQYLADRVLFTQQQPLHRDFAVTLSFAAVAVQPSTDNQVHVEWQVDSDVIDDPQGANNYSTALYTVLEEMPEPLPEPEAPAPRPALPPAPVEDPLPPQDPSYSGGGQTQPAAPGKISFEFEKFVLGLLIFTVAVVLIFAC